MSVLKKSVDLRKDASGKKYHAEIEKDVHEFCMAVSREFDITFKQAVCELLRDACRREREQHVELRNLVLHGDDKLASKATK